MTDTEDVRDTPEATVKPTETEAGGPEEVATPAEPDAGPREILIGILVVLVMLVGFVYSYNQGLETGEANGRQDALADIPHWAEALREARVAGGIRLGEGQEVHVRVTGPGEAVQETLMADAPGERVVILVRSQGEE